MKRLLICLLVLVLVVFTFAAEKQKQAQQKTPTIEELIQEGKYQEAIELGKKFEQEGQITAPILVNIGVAFYKLKDYENSLSYLSKAFEKASDPNYPDKNLQTQILLFEATVYHEMNKEDKVIEVYEKILAINPEDKESLINYARILENNNPQKALSVYDKIVELDPSTGYDAGIFAMDKGDYERAQKYFEKSLSINPNDENSLLALLKLYLKQSKYKEAIPILEKIVTITTKEHLKPNFYYFLASCYFEIKDFNNSLNYANKVLELRQNDERALVLKAKIYREMKDLKNAANSANEALKVNPENEDANYLRAIIAIEQKDYKTAKPYCEKVVNLTKNSERKKEVQDYLNQMKNIK